MLTENTNNNAIDLAKNRALHLIRKMKFEIPILIKNIGTRIEKDAILMLGNYKTGSSAIAALLATGTNQSFTSDVFCKASSGTKRRLLQKQLSIDWFIHHYRYLFSTKIIKEPDFIFYMDQLEALFPNSRYVFFLRDPRENIRSILNFLNLPGNLNDLTDEQLKSLPGSIWILSIEGTLFGTRGENYIATQAFRWKRIVEIYEQYADKMILLKYETFKQDKVSAIRSLANQLGLEITQDIAPYLNIQYQPKGDHSKKPLDFFGHKNLAIIESICGQQMKRYGYSI